MLWAIAIIALGVAAVAIWQAWRVQANAARLTQAPARANTAASASVQAITPTVDPAVAASDDFAQVLALLRGRLDHATPDEIMALLSDLAKTRPADAIELAQSLGRTGAEKSALVGELAKQWTLRAPQAAWDWLAQLSPQGIDALAEGEVPSVIFNAMAGSDPALLLRNVDAALRGGERGVGMPPAVAVHLGLESLAENHALDAARVAVETWARDPARPVIGESAYITVANALRATDPQAAAQWLIAQPASADRDVAVTEFSAHWAQQDPVAALQWAESLPSPELQMSAVQRTFNDWVERDATPATQWLGDFLTRAPANAQTDRLIEGLINLGGVGRNSPELALQWSSLLSEPAKRAAYEKKISARQPADFED